MRQRCGDDGVSEVVAAALLVGLTVLGVAIVAAIFLSSPQPDEIPHTAIVAGNRSGNFALTHEGGDSLKVGEYRIYAGAGGELQDVTDKFTEPLDGMWSIGETLVYDGPVPERVIVVSRGTETILSEPTFVWGGKVFDPDPVVPGDPEEPEEPEEKEPIDIIIEENVFVYGTALSIGQGGVGTGSVNIMGPGATIVITGGLNDEDLGGNGGISVSNIYIDGSVNKGSGSAGLGSKDAPGVIYINGDLILLGGSRNIYGKVYVNGDCDLGGVIIHDEMYVNGDVTLRRNEISFVGDAAHIYCVGSINRLPVVDSSTLNHCTNQTPLTPFPEFPMLDLAMPPTKHEGWYNSEGYTSNGPLTDNKKIFAPSYTSPSGVTASNVIIIASDGDISITEGWSSKVSGIFFAPKGRVTFNGGSLEGVIIARDGLFVINGNTKVTFKNITDYIDDLEDYPF